MKSVLFTRTCRLLAALALGAAATGAGATVHTVTASGFSFSPANITVAPGDTIHWVDSSGSHTVTSGTNCTFDNLYFDHALNSLNPSFDWVVPSSGVGFVPYFCRIHCSFGMVGTITVVSGSNANFTITVDGGQEVPPVVSTATGSGTATIDTVTNLFSWDITLTGLVGQTAAHFHGVADACANAGVLIPLTVGNHLVGSTQLSSDPNSPLYVGNVMLGRFYFNAHTTANPSGEIRGQVMPSPLADPIPATIPTGSLRVRFQTIASSLTAPNWGAVAPGDSSRIFVNDQNGTLWAIDTAGGDNKTVFLDVSSRLVPLGIGGPGTYDERGFLGIAFSPNYMTNGLLYTFTSEPVNGPADFSTMPTGSTPDCQSVFAEWQVPNPSDPGSVVDPNSRREMIRIDKPQFNHNGGAMNFGPDGFLYISLGDGGAGDDRDTADPNNPAVGHGCAGNGQNTNVILGKIIRIDPSGNNSANGKYGVPVDNPFVGGGGLGEIWAYGLRNPWRYSFDSATGDLMCGDVGQNDVEEIDIITRGANYGWRAKEGSFNFVFNGDQPGYVTDQPLDLPANLTDPIAEYDHDEGIALIGGFVYRGTKNPPLVGKYVFGDFSRTFNHDGRLFYLDTGNVIKEFHIQGQPGLGLALLGFGQDANGELYIMGNTTQTPSGTTGVVLHILSGAGDMDCNGVIDFDDINPFVLALSDPASYAAQYPDCDVMNGDANYDGNVDFDDINAFVALLSS